MEAIEKQIHEHFANLSEEASERTEQETSAPQQPLRDYVAPPVLTAPFAKVNTVVDGSPASLAGLRPGDQIRNFGPVNNSNHDDLKKVAECVQGNEGVRQPLHLHEGCLLTCLVKGNGTGQGVSHRGGDAPGASASADAEARLGREGSSRLSYPSSVDPGAGVYAGPVPNSVDVCPA